MRTASFPRDDAPAWNRRAASSSPPLIVHREHDAGRRSVEAFIRRIYVERYGADIRAFAPTLVSLHDHGEPLAAAGYRAASQGPLFLERYLSRPVDELLAASASTPAARATIVEVGHLAAARAGEGRRLIRRLGPHLADLGFDWVVGTLTRELHHVFLRMGISPLILGQANPAALGEEAGGWGSYYDHAPAVLAGDLRTALHRLMPAGVGSGDAA
jgi:hypothetical protein